MENPFASLVDSSASVLILLPTKPYFDQVAAGLSLFLSLRSRRDVAITCPSPMLVEFNRLVGVNKIGQDLGHKNLTIKFTDYKASDVERVSYDIENGEFRLTVVPKPGSESPKKEQVNLNYSGTAADTIILVGGANETHFPALTTKELGTTKLVHVGIRPLSFAQEKQVISFIRPAATISEIAAMILKENGFEIDFDIATNLVLGIEEGSSHFASPEVTAETFEIFAHLIRAGGQRYAREKVAVKQQSPLNGANFNQLQAAPMAGSPAEIEVEKIENKELPQTQNPPADWLAQPKIYKGTSIS